MSKQPPDFLHDLQTTIQGLIKHSIMHIESKTPVTSNVLLLLPKEKVPYVST